MKSEASEYFCTISRLRASLRSNTPHEANVLKKAAIAELGADLIVDTNSQDLAEVLTQELEAGRGVDIAIDCVGGESVGKYLHCLNKGARWIMIAALAGSHRAEVLKRGMVAFNTRKHSNEKIFYNVDRLEKAILGQKQVSFQYFDLNEGGEKVYRREGSRYTAEPVALVFNEDNYYLTCYSPRHDSTVNYRVDRMDRVEVLSEDACEKAISLRAEVATYTEQAFKMFGGETADLVLEFDRSLIGAVYDRFGEGTKMMAVSESKCIAAVKVQVSPVFWGWLFQFAGQMQILSPSHLIEAYKERCRLIAGA